MRLGRLSAVATASPSWGLGWVYDGFGNRLLQNVTKGTAISVQMSVSPATNRLLRSDIAYDANGNLTNWTSAQGAVALTYDIENRVTQVTAPNGMEAYRYTARNQRVVKGYPNNSDLQTKLEMYGAGGEWLGEYTLCEVSTGQYQGRRALCYPQIRVHFGGRPVHWQSGELSLSSMVPDRLGSAIQTFPYGDTLNTVYPDKESFATYTRDGVDGLDYAQNRYYYSTWGRFLSADPYQASGGAGNPASWNRYAYVEGDPANNADPSGLLQQNCGPNWTVDASLGGPCEASEGDSDPRPWNLWEADIWVKNPTYGWLQNGHGQVNLAAIDWGSIAMSLQAGNFRFLQVLQSTGALAQYDCAPAGPWRGHCLILKIGLVGVMALWDVFNRGTTAREAAPIAYEPYAVGRDDNGDCLPPDPDKFVRWRGTGGDHWHWIDWNTNPVTCITYPRLYNGPNDPGARFREIGR